MTGWREEKKNLLQELEVPAGTISTQPVWHNKTSSRFNFKWAQIGSVPRWLSQVNPNPQIPSRRTGLSPRLATPQTCYQPDNALWFQGRLSIGGKCVHLELRKRSSCFLKKNKMILYMDLGHSTSIYSYVSTICITEVSKQFEGTTHACKQLTIRVSIWFTFGLFCQNG